MARATRGLEFLKSSCRVRHLSAQAEMRRAAHPVSEKITVN
jgi:hypothetical protein